jgi:LemA protein
MPNHKAHLSRIPALSVAAVALLPLLSGCGYGELPAQRERARAAWAEVAEQHQRRSELAALLAESLRASATSADAVNAVLKARASESEVGIKADALPDATSFGKFREADKAVAEALRNLLASARNDPAAMQSQGFSELKSQVDGTELRIAASHFDFADTARIYNTSLRTLPGLLWARLWYRDHGPIETFSIAETRIVPRDAAASR